MCYALNRLQSQEQSWLSRGVASASPGRGICNISTCYLWSRICLCWELSLSSAFAQEPEECQRVEMHQQLHIPNSKKSYLKNYRMEQGMCSATRASTGILSRVRKCNDWNTQGTAYTRARQTGKSAKTQSNSIPLSLSDPLVLLCVQLEERGDF